MERWLRHHDLTAGLGERAILSLELYCDSDQNLLTRNLLAELGEIITYYSRHNPPRALIIYSRKQNSFCEGTNLKKAEFKEQSRDIFQKIREAPFPVVAAISGSCLREGLELALACHARIAVDNSSTQFVLSERGLVLSASDALSRGLIDGLVNNGEELILAAKQLAGSTEMRGFMIRSRRRKGMSFAKRMFSKRQS